MSFYFRDKPRFSDRLRGKSGDELLQEIKQQFDEDSKSFFEPSPKHQRDSFDRHGTFSRGFPFDDDGFPRRSDIRSHLDDLAARHPEFADHLLGPAWGDIPFQGTLRNRRRGSASGSSHQGHPDDDARSQASGSSAASAASGASGVSSHGEPEPDQRQSDYETRRNPIPQYGLRNTVDIGQHQHDMENSDKGHRGQRSMSAPPENRQQQQTEQSGQQSQTPQNQRYVSRVDITPQHNQSQQQSPQQSPQQPPQSQQKSPQQGGGGGNVRHIPIFVEGRDEPVIPRKVDDAPFRREPSPTQFHSSPHHFARSSPFGQHFGTRQHQWPPQFQDPFPQRETFFQPQPGFEQPTRKQQSQTFQEPKQRYQNRQQHPEQHYEQPKPQPQQKTQQQQKKQPQQQQQQQQQPQQPEPPKPKQTLPKDPLERVALVQKEVDSLAEQVKQYTGNSRKDKQYIYLDEMLTRELIKLDDIETEGRDNVRQARKNAIRCIQETISLLESKAPLASQPSQTSEETDVQNGGEAVSNAEAAATEEKMEIDQKQEEQSKEAIPLPPGPSSPTKKVAEENETPAAQEGTKEEPMKENTEQPEKQQDQSEQQQPTAGEPMDTTPAKEVPESELVPMEVQQTTENADSQPAVNEAKKDEVTAEEKPENAVEKMPEAGAEVKKSEGPAEEKKSETLSEKQPPQTDEQKATDGSEKMEVDAQPAAQAPSQAKSTPRKAKKTKKQAPPVSEQAIPLPAPGSTETSTK